MSKVAVVVPWVTEQEIEAFLREWGIEGALPQWLVLQHDAKREGCSITKNRGVLRAMKEGFDTVVVLDGDCYPEPDHPNGATQLDQLVDLHMAALEPQRVELFRAVTEPPSRGTPYFTVDAELPVAASMGFWTEIGDYCAVRQLAHRAGPMSFDRSAIFARYFPLCGMNLAFRPSDWLPWCLFIDVPRFDDIWMGWLWQKEATRRGHCFNLGGPVIRHVRQSNAWKNLKVEAEYLEANETLWREIAMSGESEYRELIKLLPNQGRSDG